MKTNETPKPLPKNLDTALRLIVEILRLQQPHEVTGKVIGRMEESKARRPNYEKYPVGTKTVAEFVEEVKHIAPHAVSSPAKPHLRRIK